MNSIVLLGRVGTDPDLRKAQGGDTNVCRWRLAVPRPRQQDQADWFDCAAFGQTAEFVERYFSKGMRMCLKGHVQTGSYTNRDGQKTKSFDVVVETVEFCESKKKEEPSYADTERQQAAEGFMQMTADDPDGLPFV